MTKYIFITGSVFSGVGKGIATASIALLLKMRGEKVQLIKLDNYYNLTCSTIAPREHGEIFVLDDGSETDLDLGSYERIANIDMSKENICTSGIIYSEILEEEREGKYLGQTVQIIPHVTNKIQERLMNLGQKADIVVVEIGGTVGDLESGHFYEAIRQFKQKLGEDNVLLVNVAPILWVNTIKEHKTKPLQNSIKELQRFGLQTDMLLCRVDRPVPGKLLDKISNLTGVSREAIFEAPDVKSIYEVPIAFYDRHIDDFIADRFKLRRTGVRIHKYRELVEKYCCAEDLAEVTVGVVGKYSLEDAYLSLKEAIYHAGASNNCKVNIKWIEAEKLEEYSTLRGVQKFFEGVNAIIVPGGFDIRGVEGKIKAIEYARERKIPFLGICLGLQCAVIEFSRNICGLKNANSVEFVKDGMEPVIHFVPGMEHIRKKGGTLRLGAYDCALERDSIAFDVYQKPQISERHRHRYEVNQEYIPLLESNKFKVSGRNPQTDLVEIMELDREMHPYFIGVQFHPEFKSRLQFPHPLFDSLLFYAKKNEQ